MIAGFDAATAVNDTERERHARALIPVERAVLARDAATGIWKPSREISFYLSSRPVTSEIVGDALRNHWGIENTSDHTRDGTFLGDTSRFRRNPGIFARIRSLALQCPAPLQVRHHSQDRLAAALGGLEAIYKVKFSKVLEQLFPRTRRAREAGRAIGDWRY